MKNTRVVTAICLLAILVGSLVIRLPLLPIPLERDEGTYGYVAWRISHGEVPYRDVFDHKPPGVYGAYWIALNLFGHTPAAIHLFGALYNLLSVILVFVLARRLFDSSVGLIAAAAYAVMSCAPAYNGQSANTELFLLPPMLIAAILVWQALSRPFSPRIVFLGGVAAGAAVLTKQSAAPLAVLLVLAVLLRRGWGERRWRPAGVELAALAGGVALPLALTAGLFWSLHAFDEFYDATVRYNAAYGASALDLSGLRILGFVARTALPSQAAFWAFGVLGLAVLLRQRKSADLFAAGFFAAGLLGVTMGLRFFGHYFIQLLPALAICFAVGLSSTWTRLRHLPRRLAIPACTGLVAVCSLLPVVADYRYYFVYAPDEAVVQIYGAGQPFHQAALVADYLQQASARTDKAFIIGSEPQIHLLAERACVGRYPYIFPLMRGPRTAERQGEALASLAATPPLYLVLVICNTSIVANANTPPRLFDELGALIRRSYYLDAFVSETTWGMGLFHRSPTNWNLFLLRAPGIPDSPYSDAAGLARNNVVPHPSQILLFRRRGPDQTLPDVRSDWSIYIAASK